MQGSNTFIFEELDQQSKDYLLAISKNKGIGFPGVYASKLNYGILFIIFGIFNKKKNINNANSSSLSK